jgi:hypothetical protein
MLMTASRLGLNASSIMLGVGMMLAISGCGSGPIPPVATVDRPCPPWEAFPTNHHSNADSPYLGCSSNANLRAMVADPADLDRGKLLGPASGDRESRAVELYQQGKVKAFGDSGPIAPSITMTTSGGGGAPQ